MVTNWRSDVYRLFPMCHVYIKIRTKFSASECLLPNFLKHLLEMENYNICK